MSEVKFDPALIKMLRNSVPKAIAESLVDVHPMDPTLFKQAMDAGMTEEQLIAEGYEPVSHMKLLWGRKMVSQFDNKSGFVASDGVPDTSDDRG